jgi:hypothetical protein
MSYLRVIPRDLFNEANLLKCYGKLYIETEGIRSVGFSEQCLDSFDVVQREDDGYLFIENLLFLIHGVPYRLVRPLNSREQWPLYAEKVHDPEFELLPVFESNGNLSPEMGRLIEGGTL